MQKKQSPRMMLNLLFSNKTCMNFLSGTLSAVLPCKKNSEYSVVSYIEICQWTRPLMAKPTMIRGLAAGNLLLSSSILLSGSTNTKMAALTQV